MLQLEPCHACRRGMPQLRESNRGCSRAAWPAADAGERVAWLLWHTSYRVAALCRLHTRSYIQLIAVAKPWVEAAAATTQASLSGVENRNRIHGCVVNNGNEYYWNAVVKSTNVYDSEVWPGDLKSCKLRNFRVSNSELL